ncbi:hypothetical protein PAAG_11872 [Paracoccidioides lutzii Pb01]|uniref:Zn(2)-C6 fungal-type domain-containing protein n=1 Tax=Paracoccidioides lutzii (strain ATCC MYA-826 / Pb01) TaxID=502779 RepID=A0A0A2V1M1_PARBA|nr:hypothetical protein PAAG_11872 [Paracoccidioides lutzii Pb01]KGQ01408.1 hypothetical protein PAAG_11872 [Paracoccidioides lutzii Pb01]
MPGILPMKVIKVGNSSQSRVAQACDRCRSKKIRCDGIRPCCSQCAYVGFECKTSDKLSRRAFPRGYTESLEDRVRALEAEVRELKGLLDEKDEKIDVLSRLHSFSTSRRASLQDSTGLGSSNRDDSSKSAASEKRDELIRVQHSCSLLRKPTINAPFTGPSSTRASIDAFASKLEISGKSASGISTDVLLSEAFLPVWSSQDSSPPQRRQPRLITDQLVNIFFQEWAPIYPVLHRPTMLKIYGDYVSDPDAFENDKYYMAQLNLIFGISAISAYSRVPQDPTFFEQNWQPRLDALAHDVSLPGLQCYILAQIYYSIKADYKSLLRYRGLAVGVCHQLGLHQSQRGFSFTFLASETRKRVFWCQYVLDRFAAALTGLPVLMLETDICAEYPADIDDENLTDSIVPTLTGELTRISSALALFSVSRILSKVLAQLYPSPSGYDVSLSTVHSLAKELDEWQQGLPPHIRLEFAQDKPSANVTGNRSPILNIDLGPECKLVKEAQKLLSSAASLVECESTEAAAEFTNILNLVSPLEDFKHVKSEHQQKSNPEMPGRSPKCKSPRKAPSLESRHSFTLGAGRSKDNDMRRSTVSKSIANSSPELCPRSIRSSSSVSISSSANPEMTAVTPRSSSDLPSEYLNLDYLPLGDEKVEMKTTPTPSNTSTHGYAVSEWDNVLGDMDSGHTNIFNGIYGGGECGDVGAASFSGSHLTPAFQYPQNPPSSMSVPPSSHEMKAWSPEGWSSSSSSDMHPQSAPSAVSYSEDTMGAMEELSPPATIGKTCEMMTQQTPPPPPPPPHHEGLDGIQIPQSLGPLDHPPDFGGGGVVDTWTLRQPA